MRRRRSTSASSGTLTRNGRIVPSSAAACARAGRAPMTPAAAELARKPRRVDDDDVDMIILLGGMQACELRPMLISLRRRQRWLGQRPAGLPAAGYVRCRP